MQATIGWTKARLGHRAGEELRYRTRPTRPCGISLPQNSWPTAAWSPNSRVVRAVSHTGALGPYSFANEVLPTFHHNPQVVRSRDGSYLMYVIGRTCGHTSDCHAGPVPPPTPHPANAACPLPNDPAPGNMESGISLFKSNLPNSSEWQSVGTVLGSNGPDASGKWTAWDSDTNNPAPLTTTFNSSGTDSNQTLLVYRGCGYEAAKRSALPKRPPTTVLTQGKMHPCATGRTA